MLIFQFGSEITQKLGSRKGNANVIKMKYKKENIIWKPKKHSIRTHWRYKCKGVICRDRPENSHIQFIFDNPVVWFFFDKSHDCVSVWRVQNLCKSCLMEWNCIPVFINLFFIHSNLTFSIHSVDIQCQIHLLPIQVHFYSIHLWNILKGDSGKKFQMLYWTARAEIVKFLWPIFSCFWHFCISWYFHFCHQIFWVSYSSIYSYSYSQKYQDVGKLG